MDIAIVIAVASGLFQIAGYFSYNYYARKGLIKLNAASWFIWTLGSILDLASYAIMTQDWVKDILPISCAVACFYTFTICLIGKKFGRLDKSDWFFVAIDFTITLVWLFFTTATEANLLYQAGTVLSFIPMYIGIKKGNTKEVLPPWVIWTMAYGLFGLSVFLRLNSWTEMAYPVTCFVVHGYTVYLTWRHNRST